METFMFVVFLSPHMVSRITRRSVLTSIAASTIGMTTTSRSGWAADGSADEDTDVYIVLAGGSTLTETLEREGYEILQTIAGGSLFLVHGAADEESDIRSLPLVNDVAPNYTVTNNRVETNSRTEEASADSVSTEQWDKKITDTFDAHATTTGDGTTLAIIDTGVDHSHPDLKPVLDTERSRFFRNGRIYSGTGTVRERTNPQGLLAETREVEKPLSTDVAGHGTHVAGIAAAPQNATRVVGTAPDTTVVSLRTMFYEERALGFSESVWTVADTLLALDYAVEIGADVVNLSLATGPLPASVNRRRLFAAFRRVIQYAIEQGTVVVVAAGNQELNLVEDPRYVLPSRNRGTINVAATGPNDRRRYDSNYGDGVIDVAAPGGGYETQVKTSTANRDQWGVLSAVPADVYGRQYMHLAGTSMAAPQVAGLVCLLRELRPDLHPRRVKQAIEQGAAELTDNYTAGLGAGRINTHNSIKLI